MIIDATDLIVGRFATVAAKKALLGEKVDVVNCEKAIVTGSKSEVLNKFKRMRKMGVPLQGPYFPKQADRIVRRTIRGMLPYKKHKGSVAFKNVMCYVGVPVDLQQQKSETIEEANVKKIPNMKFMTLGEVARELGGK